MTVDELTDQYVANELSQHETERAQKHFFRAGVRKEELKFAVALKNYRQSNVPKTNYAWYLRIAALLLVAAGLASVVWWFFTSRPGRDAGLVALQQSFRQSRPVESRLSVLDYAPFVQLRGETGTANEQELRRADLTLQQEISEKPTARQYQGLAAVYLAKKEHDQAINQLQQALKLEPQNAKVFADLGAVWLEKAKYSQAEMGTNQSSNEFQQSLSNLNHALLLDGSLAEALFNRALCHEYLAHSVEAKADWQHYLQIDSVSPWAAEVKQRLTKLESTP